MKAEIIMPVERCEHCARLHEKIRFERMTPREDRVPYRGVCPRTGEILLLYADEVAYTNPELS